MARECKHYCEESSYPFGKILPYNQVFSPKILPYKKASRCLECKVSVFPPSVNKIVTITHGLREEFPDKIAVRCPCCGNVCRGGPHGKSKPIKEIQKSYKELGLNKTPTRGTSESKKQVNYWLQQFERFDYTNKLAILKQYNETGFENSNYIYDTNLDHFIQLLFKLNNIKERERYVRKFCNLLDKFTEKHKLGMNGMTQEELKIEADKRLEEGNKRRAEIGPNIRYYFPYHIDVEIEGNKNETERKAKTNHDNR